ncbi:hypothetical protein MSPP1_000185 [Malassezia sp. CBS 17886]|nr:hypothetical protein MSPP1_000185 [Malassezia sp. CBS 17886]
MSMRPDATPDLIRNVSLIVSKNIIDHDPARAATALITLLTTSSAEGTAVQPTGLSERLHIVRLMHQLGTAPYLKHFVEDIRGRTILAQWLSEATPPRKADAADQSEQWKEATIPLLELLRRLPIELDHLRDHVGLGKLITGVQKRIRSDEARAIADEIKEKWSALVPSTATRAAPEALPAKRGASAAAEATAKRHKSTSPQPSAARAPAARASNSLLEGASTAMRMGRTQDAKAAPAQQTRTTARQPTKATAPAPTSRLANGAAQPLSPAINSAAPTRRPVRAAGGARSDANKDLASFMSFIDSQGAATTEKLVDADATSAVVRKPRKKAVHWKDHDGMALVAVKLIEPAVYDEDTHGAFAKGVGALDMEEGGAFRQAHIAMDELIAWHTPIPLYLNAHDIPDTPMEPDEFVLAFGLHAPEPRAMTLGSLDSGGEAPRSPSPPTSDAAQVPDLAAMAAMMGQVGGAPTSSGTLPPPWMIPGGPAVPGPPMPFDMAAQIGLPAPPHGGDTVRGDSQSSRGARGGRGRKSRRWG